MTTPFELRSPLAPAQVIHQLRQQVDPLPPIALFRVPGKGRLLGEVYESNISVRLRSGLGKNDFGAHLTAELLPCEQGTLLRGTIGPNPYLKVFRLVWAFVGAMIILLGIAMALSLRESPERYVVLIVGAGLTLLGITVNQLLALPARSERSRLLEQLSQVVNAERP